MRTSVTFPAEKAKNWMIGSCPCPLRGFRGSSQRPNQGETRRHIEMWGENPSFFTISIVCAIHLREGRLVERLSARTYGIISPVSVVSSWSRFALFTFWIKKVNDTKPIRITENTKTHLPRLKNGGFLHVIFTSK